MRLSWIITSLLLSCTPQPTCRLHDVAPCEVCRVDRGVMICKYEQCIIRICTTAAQNSGTPNRAED